MNNKNNLLSKSGYATSELAKKFIYSDTNEKIKTVTEYSKEIGVSRGTIQNSIKYLIDNKLINLLSRGQLGTFIIEKDIIGLFKIAGINFIIGSMPLPYSKRYEGLSTAIIQSIENNIKIPINMTYMRGSKNRINMVLNGRYDFTITSKFAALRFIQDNPDLIIAKELKHQSFLSKHVLMFKNPNFKTIEDGMTAGIDSDSLDQETLTYLLCKDKNVNIKKISYNQLVENLESGKIDFAVWNGDELKDKYNQIITKDLDVDDSINTIAVIIVHKDNILIKKIIEDFIDIEFVEEIQNKVINNIIIPSY
ncbi:GntR family transcriptional regulator YhfZ [Helcococcus ovis]|uniref:GntR family transcriptional regulator YhfZ n=1 Tax=Helcococcus ovis TaxID=72026 RepID=UPI0038BBBF2C